MTQRTHHLFIVHLFWVILFCLDGFSSFAQPANDNCANAETIVIGNGGFALGTFTSNQDDMTAATLQAGETFAPSITVAGLTKKSVWFKFSIATTRSVRVSLLQPGNGIQAGNVGFTVYKSSNCLPNIAELSTKLSPIETFGNTFHPCVSETGDYLVQVSSNATASGPIYITVELADGSPALYDKPSTAYKFGKPTTNKVTAVDFAVECQSIDSASENCLPATSFKNYTKSTWHTFTTPDYFDYFSVLLAFPNSPYNAAITTIGYRIYEGDATVTPLTLLTQIGGCDSLVTNGFYPDRKLYRCGDLKTGTTYTIQLLYYKDFIQTVRLAIAWDGTKATTGPIPVITLPTPNKMGVLSANASGLITTAIDNFGCNSRHIQNSCPKSILPNGLKNANGYTYNLSSFFSFSISSTCALNISALSDFCLGSSLLLRLYKQDLTANCTDLDTSNILATFTNNSLLNCMEPGNYVLQVMGVDSLVNKNYSTFGSLINSIYPLCLVYNFGRNIRVSIVAKTLQATNKFSLSSPGMYDHTNPVNGVMQPLVGGKNYISVADTFGCANTVLPIAKLCGADTTKVVYREFIVNDSMMVNFTSNMQYQKLYKGDADALAQAQNKFTWPNRIAGLDPFSPCLYYYNNCNYYMNGCVTPGAYTLAIFGGVSQVGQPVTNTITVSQPTTKHFTPTSAQDLGSLWDSASKYNTLNFTSDIDSFTCRDNATSIGNYVPCSVNGQQATKLIYRQFYLSEPTLVNISSLRDNDCRYGGIMTLFTGKATDGLQGLTPLPAPWQCFTNARFSNQCTPLPAGWYTVVSYGFGPSYNNPLQGWTDQNATDLGNLNQYVISLTKACAMPKFNRPYKASVDTITKKPYLIQYAHAANYTAAYPVNGKTFILNQENFNCTTDTPFNLIPVASCGSANTKVAFYVFTITQEAYVKISTGDGSLWGSVYPFDVRKDSAKFNNGVDTALQPCLNKEGRIEFCSLQPGVYTLVLFAPSTFNCNSTTPSIYIDSVGISRFDHAANAYDFGDIAPDSIWHNGKKGDVNPLNPGRAPSNDFFFCTTGAQVNDPINSEGCYIQYNPFIYPLKTNKVLHPINSSSLYATPYNDRRNLWYTFIISQPGTVRVMVNSKFQQIANYAVFKSDKDAAIPFNTLVSSGKLDSTLAQGLTFVISNYYQYSCYYPGASQVSFYNEPCAFVPGRYYILLDNYYGNNLNEQVEVSVLLDSVNAVKPKFDHFSQANDLGLVNSGIKKGAVDNFTCASRDLPDPVTCQKSLWYKFTTTVTGQIRYSSFTKNTNNYTPSDIQLFLQVKPNDSSSTGLQYQPYTTTYTNNGTWAQRCISPGTYYLILPGCNALNEDVYPQIEIIPQAGDFCSAPLVAALNGSGSSTASLTVDCHTIGTDYGEFNTTLTCPPGALTSKYKSSWYRLDIGGKDTLDLTVYINENTNANSSEIKYRMMTGNCGAMQEQSCIEDALTRNTYKCLAPGNSYYIQVFTPLVTAANGQVVTGSIDLITSAVVHANVCLPGNNCIAVANFTPQFDCTVDKYALFTNFSTYGTDITYQWDFGYNNQTSTSVSPLFLYPSLTTDVSYNVKLKVTNKACGKTDEIAHSILIPARPAADLGNDTIFCKAGSSITYDATTFTGSTYKWSNGITQPKATFTSTGTYWVEVTYKNCKAKDTVNVWINPIAKQATQTQALCGTNQVTFNDNRGRGELYTWSTGAITNSITVYQAGYYWCDLYLNGCIVRDSFLVVSADARPLGNDTTICQVNLPYIANATINGATAYKWQNNSTNPKFNMTQAGIYWVDITFSGCTFRDSFKLSVDSFKTTTINPNICPGGYYQLLNGKKLTAAGIYYDSIRNVRGCDSIITTIKLTVSSAKKSALSISLCNGQTYKLPSGQIINSPGLYSDTVRYVNGCDSLVTTVDLKVGNPIITDTTIAHCQGQFYTLPSGAVAKNSGYYLDTVKSKLGCDSLITKLTFTVDSATKVAVINSACSGIGYKLPSGKLVYNNGIYKDTLRNVRGCDSLITTTTLTINQPVKNTLTQHICSGQTFTMPSGKTVIVGGIYFDTLRSVKGCDSLINSINLLVDAPIYKTLQASVCARQNFVLPSGKVVSVAGTYPDTLRNVRGCDSVYYSITLMINSPVMIDTTIARCLGQSYTLPSGAVAKNAGYYVDTLKSKLGCDSLITKLTFTIDLANKVAVITSTCSGIGYKLPSGKVVYNNGIYTDTLRNGRGCDSLITTTTLTITQPLKNTLTQLICPGQTFTLPSGRGVNMAGIFSDTLKGAAGCDSIIFIIDIRFFTPVNNTITAFICPGQNFILPSGKIINNAGTYYDTLKYISGCDSIHFTILLKSYSPLVVNLAASICKGQNYVLPSGKLITDEGTYADTLRYLSGCDSIVYTFVLTVMQPLHSTINKIICQGQNYKLPSGKLVTVGGTYSDTLRYLGGCDSIIYNYVITVLLPLHSTITTSICQGQNYKLPSGKMVTAGGTYTDTLRYLGGCDSIIYTFVLTVLPPLHSTINSSICQGQNYILPSGRIVNLAGVYIDTIRSQVTSCDSIITTQLQVKPPLTLSIKAPTTICAGSNAILTAIVSGGNGGPYIYNWNGTIQASNQITVAPLINTKYKVSVTDNCTVKQATDSITLAISQPFTIKTTPDTSICIGSSLQLFITGAVSYQWIGAGLSQYNTNNPIAKPIVSTTYTVVAYGKDQCFTDTAEINIKVIQLPVVAAGRDTTVMVGVSFPLSPTYSQDISKYYWSPSDYLSCINCASPIVTPLMGTLYTITVENSHGCTASSSKRVNLLCNNDGVFIPNTFTPNGDGVNDVFYPRGRGIRSVIFLRIYNRWGEMVFERTNFNTDDRSAGWDGSYKGKKLSSDVFVYSAQVVCDNGQSVELKGTMMLVR